MNGKIKYMIVFLTLILLGIGFYLFLQEKKIGTKDKKREGIVSFEEKLLAALPPDVKEEELNKHVFSPDGRSVAYILKKGNKFAVVVNNAVGPEYDDVGPPHFSPDGKTLAYKAKEDSTWVMVIGEKKSEKFDDIDYPLFSPDGKRVAYGAKEGNKWFMVVDDKKSERYDKVEAPSFSADGKRVAYRGNFQTEKKSLIVIDDKKGEKYDWVTDPHFSPDGKRVAYSAQEGDRWFMVVDEKKSEQYDAVGLPVFSPDGKRFAYAARGGDKSFIVADDKKSEQYDGIWNPCFSPDGKRIAYCVKKGNEWFMVVDGKKGEQYDDLSSTDPSTLILGRMRAGMPPNIPIGTPCFSPDSKRVGYWAKEGDKRFIIVDGKKSKQYDDVSIPYFSPDGKRVAYGVKEGDKWFMVVDEEKYSALNGIIPKEVPIDQYRINVTRKNVVVFSTSLEKIAYICLSGKKYFVAVNDKISEEFNFIGGAIVNNGLGITVPIEASEGKIMLGQVESLGTSLLTFGNEYSGTPYLHISSDGKKVAFGARKGRELWWKVIKID